MALTVAVLGSLGIFVTTAKHQMTARAVAQVAVDWQVEPVTGTDSTTVADALRHRAHVRVARLVGFATTSGLEATVGGTTQTTGPGVVLGLPADYLRTFPGTIRALAGSTSGVLLAQQTAANLHASPGDVVQVGRAGMAPVSVRVDGVVDLPSADSLFQHVGAPPGAQAQAPPDNVLVLPLGSWHAAFDGLAAARPDLVHQQVHVGLDHRLPSDPAAAYSRTTGMAHRFEVDLAGGALVGDNLGATLDAARADALYAEVLFLLLGLPGAALAALLTRTVAATGRNRRRREQALLRARGATAGVLQRLAVGEALLIGLVGAAVGLLLAAVAGRLAFGSATFGATSGAAIAWAGASAAAGLALAIASVAVPAGRDARAESVSDARRDVAQQPLPAALRYGVDVVVLVAAGLLFWATSRGHYSLVLAPEGVPTVSVSYWALASPLLLWVGAGLLVWRVADLVLGRGRRLVRRAIRPLAGNLSGPVSSGLSRRRRPLAAAVSLVSLTLLFAVSTAVFNATYRQQVRVDALLTNGADVTVSQPPAARPDRRTAARLAQVPGVRHVEAVEHRFAYVGSDLQDLYGVDPRTVGRAGHLQDAYFGGGSAGDLLARLARQPDAALVSAETVVDFQLHLGDELHLRLRDARSGALKGVTFHYAGIVKEFPTAPTDSFLVANATYLDGISGGTAQTYLLDTGGHDQRRVAQRVRADLGSAATVTDLQESRRVVGSSLTAVDLAGLTRLELGFALVLTVGTFGLVMALGLVERRRGFAVITAVGARPRQLGAFIRSEAAVLAGLGGVTGVAFGWLSAQLLVKVLAGVFDPPPAHLAVPWGYLVGVGALALGALVVASASVSRVASRPSVELLRE